MSRLVLNRRVLFGGAALSLAAASVPGVFAEELTRTPAQTEGPFYPDRLPLDTDNDLLVINNGLTPGVGTVTHLVGRVLDSRGEPVRDALVEIWQVDGKGVYIHTQCPTFEQRDRNFQGFGRFLTGSTGEYRFRTVKPVAYPGRTPHIHVKVRKANRELLVTQCYSKGEAQNARDGIYRSIRDPKQLENITVAFEPLPGSRVGELMAKFDIVLGFTPPA